ncbi:hypothetical protein LEP1GSC115_4879 [Leptospira interrogans serovar Australis str. 200703203]|uniref:Uncharacterized protein n=1 Tax=Leptospira interrogans serovar Australis str. 200703203 TaxID=1085541 RepID=N1UE05_LEPIR|nr:hypothetical protein LEP1GSC115_4879 [Leptospira interrogans serovar Australis str. 200703203]
MLFDSLWFHKFRQFVFSHKRVLGSTQDSFSILFSSALVKEVLT